VSMLAATGLCFSSLVDLLACGLDLVLNLIRALFTPQPLLLHNSQHSITGRHGRCCAASHSSNLIVIAILRVFFVVAGIDWAIVSDNVDILCKSVAKHEHA